MSEQKENKSAFKRGGMFERTNYLVFELAKELRRNMTDAEKLLWNYLKTGVKGLKFRRQHPIRFYIADFYCHKIKLIIEIDGKIHSNDEIKEKDNQREKDLMSWGYTICRFTNERIFGELDTVLAEINSIVENLFKSLK
jgi:cyclase